MKFKPVFVGIAVIGVLLLVLSLSSVAKVFAANPRDLLTGVKTQPLAAQLLSKRSPFFISFLVDPEKLGLFTQLAAKPNDRASVRHELDNLKLQLQQNWLLNYDRDIQPWLDREISLAITDADLDKHPENGLQSGYLLAFVAKDANLAKTTIGDFWQRLAINGSDLGFEQYQGVSILSTGLIADRPAIAGTTFGNFVLFANDASVIRQAIDNLQSPSLALASLDTYRDRLTKIETGKIGVAYANLAELGESFPQESLLIGFSLDRAGIRAKTLWNLEKSDPKLEPATESSDRQSTSRSSKPKVSKKSNANITAELPSGSSVIIGNNLGQTLQDVSRSLSPESQKGLTKAIASLLGNSDISLDGNIWEWAKDDYAIAVLPSQNSSRNSDPDWLLVAKVNDAKTSETGIAALDDLARNKLTVGQISLKTQPVTVWTKLSAIANDSKSGVSSELSGSIVAAHTQTPNYIYLSNSLKALESAITLKDSLAASKIFKATNAKLPRDRQTYGYISTSDLNTLKTKLLSQASNTNDINEIFQKFGNSPLGSILKHLEVFSFVTNSDTNSQNDELFLFIK
ncbi:MAG: hypothetical protein DCF19_11450 [Pseudanabaena frigida]|uniref:DUF3352 domain-containing protein n=1 Tax=Pseudanabaena frigida TaxID=945775 RepID=A0A2W4XZ47_9CYAN|nr:MAG: hypothetical protein DCF19_11450 [Pseudanabaena frigida]